MPVPIIAGFLIDADNEAKFHRHRVSTWQVRELLDHRYIVVRNRKQRRASHLLIGRDRSGRCFAVPIEPTHDPTRWRPVTAWECKPAERALLDRGG